MAKTIWHSFVFFETRRSSTKTKQAAVNYRVDLVEELSSRRLEHSVYSVTDEILNTLEQLIKANERTLRLHVRVPTPPRHTSTTSLPHRYSGQLSLLPSAGREMNSSLRATG